MGNCIATKKLRLLWQRIQSKKGRLASSGPVLTATEVWRDTAAQVTGRRGRRASLRTKVLSGSVILLVSTGVVAATNLFYNFVIAHGLGAAGFGHASAIYSILMLVSALTLSFQLVSSKLIARSDSSAAKIGIYQFLHRRAWLVGVAAGALLFGTSPFISRYLNLPTRHYVDILAGGIILFIPLGVRRGFMQGICDFPQLGLNFVVEVVVKLAGAAILIEAGLGVSGVVAAIAASVVLAYLVAKPRQKVKVVPQRVPATLREGVQSSVFFAGQVVINNLDILLVKHFFTATEAGIYAAVALVGRLVYSLCWSVVSGMFPFSAKARSHEGDGKTVLNTAVLMVVLITSVFTLGVWLTPTSLWHFAFGAGFPMWAFRRYSSLLVLYAVTTGIYSLSVVLMSYEISRKIGNATWVQLGISAAIVAGIYMFHSTLETVIMVQLVLMVALLLMVAVPFLRAGSKFKDGGQTQILVPAASGFQRIRRVKEEEVIAEYLKSEFYHPEFDGYREQFEQIVVSPDLESDEQNKLRRALLYVRRGRLWQELPGDTEWWELHFRPSDLHRIRVFPRKHWCRFAKPNFYFREVMGRIEPWVNSNTKDAFAEKLRALNTSLASAPPSCNTVLLIGMDDRSPLTIIDGNHRMAAASLSPEEGVYGCFRFVCGFSPRMTECCWYQTDLSTLWRYARNYVTYVMDDHNMVIQHALESRLS